MLDEHVKPYVIGFGSCKRFEESTSEAGTDGWFEEVSNILVIIFEVG